MSLLAATCFSGIGAPEVAMPHWNWRWCAEIEKFPSAVMAARHPQSVNLGDVTAEDFMQRASSFGQLDVLAGGPPCQAFSVAGLRKSMDDDRGNLSLRFVKIAHAIRPRNLLVENVPGWLNTPDNAFGCFLGAILGCDDALHSPEDGAWPRTGMASGPLGRLCWATLDAQYFGVAQRRRRVFVVVDFGGGADPAAVLFEPQSMLRDNPPRREKGQSIAGTVARSSFSGGAGGRPDGAAGNHFVAWPAEIAPTLNAAFGDKQGLEDQHINGGAGLFVPEITGTITSGISKGPRGTEAVDSNWLVADTICFEANMSMQTPQTGELHPTLTRRHHASVAFPINTQLGLRGADTSNSTREGLGLGSDGDPSFTLQAAHSHAVAFGVDYENNACKADEAIGPLLSGSKSGGGRPLPALAYRTTGNNGAYETGDRTDALTTSTDPNSHVIALQDCSGREKNQNGAGWNGDVAYTVDAAATQGVAFPTTDTLTRAEIGAFYGGQSAKSGSIAYSNDVSPTLKASDSGTNRSPSAHIGWQVRRLTPVECERLQGFPDNFTNIEYRSKPASDGPRYKALGNSWAVPVGRWIMERIERFMP